MNERLVRELARNPVKLGYMIGFNKLKPLHNEWMRRMIYSHEDETLLGHRSSYKTTCLSLSIALIIIFLPFKNMLFLRKTDDDVKEVVMQVANILKSDEAAYIVKQVYGVDLEVYATAFTINTNLHTSKKGATQLLGMGTAASLTGKHADIIFTDDIVNPKDRVSAAERNRIKFLYMELENVKNKDGRIFNTGTPWHKEDAISSMPNVKRYDCYSTGLITKEELQAIRSKMTPSLFAANYELKHIASDNALFEAPKYTDKTELIHNGIAHIDAAYGGDDGTAFTIGKISPDNQLVMYGKRFNKHIDDCLNEIYALCKYYKAGTIYCEQNADKGYLAKEIRKAGRPVKTYHEDTNKYIKISTHLKGNWANIIWLDGTDPDYMNEILDYTETAAHDDSPDSASCMVRQLTGKGEVKVNKLSGGI